MEIDSEIEATASQLEAEGDIFPQAPRRIRRSSDDHLVQVRVALNDRRRKRLDQVADVCVRIPFAESSNSRRRQDDIADPSQSNQQDPRELVSWRLGEFVTERLPGDPATHQLTNSPIHQLVILYGGFVDEHHRNVVFDGIHTFARPAFQRGTVFDGCHGCFAVRTRKNLEQLGIDWHIGNI